MTGRIPLLSAALTLWLPLPCAAAGRVPVGMNLDAIADWGTEFSFADAFKASRAWFSGTPAQWEDGRPISLDEHGWVRALRPGQIARTLLFWDLSAAPGGYPAGRYTVEYDGQGSIEYGGSAQLVEHSTGRDLLDIDPKRGGGIGIFLTATDPKDHIRNIRVKMPKDAATDGLFYRAFIDQLKGFPVLRFQSWMLGAENNQIHPRRWGQRSRLDDAQWSVKGVPVEAMAALANKVGADPWFTISHLADDDYARRFAGELKRLLNPARKVYVEDSNEVFNPEYPQAAHARERGLALKLSEDGFEAQMRYHALRTLQIGKIFREVLGRNRVVLVLGAWSGEPRAAEIALAYKDTAAQVDALAIAPYFVHNVWDPAEQSRISKLTLDELLGELDKKILPQVKHEVQVHAAFARKHNLPLIAYEGGQHLVGVGPGRENEALNKLFDAANRDPRMGGLYMRYLNDWADAGGGLFVHFMLCGAFSREGRFGAIEYLGQPREQAPKYDALLRFMGK